MRRNEMDRDMNRDGARNMNRGRSSLASHATRSDRDSMDFDRGNDFDRDYDRSSRRTRDTESDWAGDNGRIAFGDDMDTGQRFDVSDRDYPRSSRAGRAYGSYDDAEYGRSTSNLRSYDSDRGNEHEGFRSRSARNAATGYGASSAARERGFGTGRGSFSGDRSFGDRGYSSSYNAPSTTGPSPDIGAQGLHGDWNRHHAGGRMDTERGGMYGKGPKGWRRSDERIREEVCEALSNDIHLDASEIDVKVESGTVTLSGTVTDRESKRAAESCVEHLSGVEDVHNEIRVQRQSGTLSSLNGGSASTTGGSASKTAKLS